MVVRVVDRCQPVKEPQPHPPSTAHRPHSAREAIVRPPSLPPSTRRVPAQRAGRGRGGARALPPPPPPRHTTKTTTHRRRRLLLGCGGPHRQRCDPAAQQQRRGRHGCGTTAGTCQRARAGCGVEHGHSVLLGWGQQEMCVGV